MNETINSLIGLGIGILLFVILIVIGVVVFLIITNVKLFKKCNKPGWAAIVPGYSQWVQKDIAGCHWLVFVGLLLPIADQLLNISEIPGLGEIISLAGLFAQFVLYVNIAKRFNKGIGFAVGMTLLPIVFLPILAFNNSNIYNSTIEVKNCAFFNINF